MISHKKFLHSTVFEDQDCDPIWKWDQVLGDHDHNKEFPFFRIRIVIWIAAPYFLLGVQWTNISDITLKITTKICDGFCICLQSMHTILSVFTAANQTSEAGKHCIHMLKSCLFEFF